MGWKITGDAFSKLPLLILFFFGNYNNNYRNISLYLIEEIHIQP